MRDLIERHDAFGRAMMADLTGRTVPVVAPAEPVDGDFGPGRSTYAGACEGRQRSPGAIRDRMSAGLRSYVVMDVPAADAVMLAASAYVAAVWDQAVALAAEYGPQPLVSAVPWKEGVAEYRKRLSAIYSHDDGLYSVSVNVLEAAGDQHGLIRARLVPVSADALLESASRQTRVFGR